MRNDVGDSSLDRPSSWSEQLEIRSVQSTFFSKEKRAPQLDRRWKSHSIYSDRHLEIKALECLASARKTYGAETVTEGLP